MYFARFLGCFTALVLVAGMNAAADQSIYDERADAHQHVAAALATASRSGKNVVLVFGANW